MVLFTYDIVSSFFLFLTISSSFFPLPKGTPMGKNSVELKILSLALIVFKGIECSVSS